MSCWTGKSPTIHRYRRPKKYDVWQSIKHPSSRILLTRVDNVNTRSNTMMKLAIIHYYYMDDDAHQCYRDIDDLETVLSRYTQPNVTMQKHVMQECFFTKEFRYSHPYTI